MTYRCWDKQTAFQFCFAFQIACILLKFLSGHINSHLLDDKAELTSLASVLDPHKETLYLISRKSDFPTPKGI